MISMSRSIVKSASRPESAETHECSAMLMSELFLGHNDSACLSGRGSGGRMTQAVMSRGAMTFEKSVLAQARLHELIPGGAHTYCARVRPVSGGHDLPDISAAPPTPHRPAHRRGSRGVRGLRPERNWRSAQ